MTARATMCAMVLALICAPARVAAQASDPVMQSVRPHYERVKQYILASADQMSEDDLAFGPTAEVRSALAILGHIADSQHFFCSAALGESSPHETQIERDETRPAGMVQALRDSFTYCDQAYAQGDEEVLQPLDAFGGNRPRLSQLVLNTAHNWEHYGNLVTYMRLRGKVPPSSQPR
jgi:uncharacterized damage-inducible protein DinB